MVSFRPSIKADFISIYNGPLPNTFRGITAELNGKVLGIVGVYFNRNWIAFTRITNEGRKYPLSIWKAAVRFIGLMKALNEPVYAFADPDIPRSDHLLIKMGFIPVSKDWYLWTP